MFQTDLQTQEQETVRISNSTKITDSTRLQDESFKTVYDILAEREYSVVCPRGFEKDTYYIQNSNGDFYLIQNEDEFNRFLYKESFSKMYRKNT